MSENKKVKLEFEIDEGLLNSAIDVFNIDNLSVQKAIELFFVDVKENHRLPFYSQDDAFSNKDKYIKSIVDVLAGHYDYIYYVNLDDDTYLEFNTKNAYRVLEVGETGKDFFADVMKNISIIIHFDDRAKLRDALAKETLLKNLSEKGTFSIVYRMINAQKPQYFMMVISYVGKDKNKIIIEVRNVDETIRRERQQARELERISSLAHIDSLTKCLNYLAFQEERDKLSLKIKNGEHDFAILMCDLNDLKNINDDAGHLVGDEYLIRTADAIRNIFHNSKTFRIGGDEFLVVLEGEDFRNRYELVEILKSESEANLNSSGPVIAIGLADANDGFRDFSSLFMEADQRMYEHKHQLKEIMNK